ncbi:hypothetical protein HNQ59_000806 [Chitinivorax tropicus]|uniref:N-acetyltransferase n=1 Tax=Chitinivorax tropicus TaxID=714531 RepID=A0A840MKZ3_9PROT|nr:GNAT family N-acetyltransferase [Chitinivorax tropicus]MBB5017537.1 hypothetical protein [Chitinivorax tropicus]
MLSDPPAATCPPTTLEILSSLESISNDAWQALSQGHPALDLSFLNLMHQTGAANLHSGWQPVYPSLWQGGALVAAMPLYIKTHSYGEYVFDWAWADAYHRHGLRYYPKLISALPFTPISAPRLLASQPADRSHLLAAALALLKDDTTLSSLHILFPVAEEHPVLAAAGGLRRDGVQFHWHNQGYGNFEDFLGRMSHDKRKKIHQDRKKVQVHIDEIRCLTGPEITVDDWTFFHRCYAHTYRLHHATPYLSRDFFIQLGEQSPDLSVMFVAYRQGQPIATSWCLKGHDALYGRYWGALEHIPCLHFELCYYQPICFCIARSLARFEGGAQGEHKLARGLAPAATHSYHWLKHAQFNEAVSQYLAQERNGMAAYTSELNERQPFHRSPAK